MNAIRVETTVEADGELHLTDLPCRCGDKVEAVVLTRMDSLPGYDDKPSPFVYGESG